jgi:hypothetical protein
MATQYSPRVVTDSLVLTLDAGNIKSYPGNGTTWNDVSGNGRHFTWSASPSWNTAGYFNTSGYIATGPASNNLGITNSTGYTIFTTRYSKYTDL